MCQSLTDNKKCTKMVTRIFVTLLLVLGIQAEYQQCSANLVEQYQCSGILKEQIIKFNDTEFNSKHQNDTTVLNFHKSEEEISSELTHFLTKHVHVPTSEADGLCGVHSRLVTEAASRLQLWALKMVDSSARLPSGLLNGNINQLGDFDQCLGVNEGEVKGQYCLASLEVHTSSTSQIKNVLKLVRSHDVIKSNVTDPGHRIPRYSSANWAVCVPASCSPMQIQEGLRSALAPIGDLPEIDLKVTVDSQMCYVKEPKVINLPTFYTLFFFSIILSLTLLATFVDNQVPTNTKHELLEGRGRGLLMAFSLRRSWHRLVNVDSPSDDLGTLHGIRFLNAIGLILCHKSMALFFDPFINRTKMTENLMHPWTIIGRTAIIYTDSFILMSGLLAAYSLLPEIKKKAGLVNLRTKYFNRFLRITPNLVAVILFCTYVMQLFGPGPQWNMVVKHYSDMCKSYMWRNLLYIHNFFGFETMCLTHTHQLGIDMQLFLASPFMVLALWKWPRAGFATLVSLATLSTWLRYAVTSNNQLSCVIYFGMTVRSMFATANLSYILPTHRATAYIIGILLGYYLRNNPNGIQLTKSQTQLGWLITGVSAVIPWFGPYRATNPDFEYNVTWAALYTAFYPLLWCTFITGMILLCHQSRGGWIGSFMKWKYFQVFTRLAYSVYLVQFPVFFYNIGMRRHAGYSSTTDLIDVAEFLTVLFFSVVLTMLIDLPFQQIKRVLNNNCRALPGSNKIKKQPIKNENQEIERSTEEVKVTSPEFKVTPRRSQSSSG